MRGAETFWKISLGHAESSALRVNLEAPDSGALHSRAAVLFVIQARHCQLTATVAQGLQPCGPCLEPECSS